MPSTPSAYAFAPPLLTDELGRTACYLRLSVTDRCNLRCIYCRSGEETFIPHDTILRYEEMLRLVDVAVHAGVEKVRITGGEPFARKGVIDLLAGLRKRHPQLDLRVTTNGTLIGAHIDALRDLQLNTINLSLDTLNRSRFESITGRDFLPRVLENLDAMQQAGLTVKINAVAMRGFNDAELPDFLALANDRSMDVRFIEFMPMGDETRWSKEQYWPASEILEAARALTELSVAPLVVDNAGPARMYELAGGGRLGLITPLSNHFCTTCNRLRVTADGRLRTCLFDDHEYRLRPLLRNAKIDDTILTRVLQLALRRKPLGVRLLEARKQQVAHKRMTAIGG